MHEKERSIIYQNKLQCIGFMDLHEYRIMLCCLGDFQDGV